jgi:hypothetical protein
VPAPETSMRCDKLFCVVTLAAREKVARAAKLSASD